MRLLPGVWPFAIATGRLTGALVAVEESSRLFSILGKAFMEA